MNIWMFNHYAITPEFPGGTRHFELCRNIARRGHEVMLFAANYIHMSFRFLPIDKPAGYLTEDFGKFKFTWLKTHAYKRNDWHRLINMFSYCRQCGKVTKKMLKRGELGKPDVVVGSTVHPFTPLTAARLARKHGVPFIFEIRDLWPQTFIDMGLWKASAPIARFFKWIEKQTVKRADKFVVLSPLTTEYLIREYGVAPEDVLYIPNGVDLELYKPDAPGAADSRKEHRKDHKKDHTFVLIYLGGIEQVHNLDTLFEAMKELDNEKIPIELHIYGDGKRTPYFKEHYPLNNIKWMGPVKKIEVPAKLATGDALYLSTGKVLYGSENKLFEYLASGKPIISSAYLSHNNVAKDLEAGLSVTPDDTAALQDAIKQMATLSKPERDAMGKRGREYAEKNHHWPILSDRLLDTVETLRKS